MGIQQPPVQANESNAWVDVVKVLYEPGAVFERVRQSPNFLAPFLVIVAVQCVLFVINLPYLSAAIKVQMATAAAGRPVPSNTVLAVFGLVGLIVALGIIFLLSGLVLWVLTSLMGGGEAKFGTMLSVATYSAVPAALLLTIVGTIVLHMKGIDQLSSPQDMQPALGLDLIVSGAKGFLGALLKGINPFSIWGAVLMAIGVSTTQKMSKGTGYTIAFAAFAILLVCTSALAAVFNRG